MKNFNIFLLAVLLLFTGCDGDENFLTKSPTDIFVDEDVWKNEALIMGLVSDLYSRYADYQTIEKWYSFCDLDEGYCSNAVDRKRHQNATWGYGEQASWDYGYVRHMNLFLQKCARADASVFAKNSRERLMGEVRFLRAAYYFAMAKRMGGVPLITEPMQYDYSGDVTYLYRPRNPEYEIYDFVLKECEEIKTLLPNDPSVKSRATKAAALAMRSRAALYAGSIARYGALRTPEVTLPGGEVGIPAEKADYYYGIALSSAQEIMTDNLYDLYKKNPSDLADNFASMFLDKTDANTEAIFVKDFLSPNKIHNYTVYTLPQSMSEYPRYNGSLCATLNLVQLYELLDGNKIEPLKVGTPASPVFYDKPGDLFAGRDARLAGTVILPGSSFRGNPVDIWAGYVTLDGKLTTGNAPGAEGTLPGTTEKVQVVGKDGPCEAAEFNTHTGFYVRKYNDTKVGSGDEKTGSEVWFIRYRFGEILLNAAEAAFELDQKDLAAQYLTRLRERAGFTEALTEADITFDRIVHERKVELAYEGHELWDMKRWRLAHLVWNGQNMNETPGDPAAADAVNTQCLGLWPLKVHAPGTPVDGKWTYIVRKPSHVTAAHQFRIGNYYSEINTTILSNNPQIVKQPNQ